MKFQFNKKTGIKLFTKGKFCAEDIEVNLDTNSESYLIPANIRKGVSILGVVGELKEGTDALVYVDQDGSLVLSGSTVTVNDEGSLKLG